MAVDPRQPAAATPSNIRRRLTRLSDELTTFFWVAPLTILIWVYAERAQNEKRPAPLSVPISVRINAPNRIVRLIEPADPNLLAKLEGPRASLDEVVRELGSPGAQAVIAISIDPAATPGRQKLDAAAQINKAAIFVRHGVSVTECKPKEIEVEVDEIVDKTVEVAAPPDLPTLQTIRFDPASVLVRVPARIWDKITANNAQPQVIAQLGKLDGLSQGEHKLTRLPLKLGDFSDDGITFTPAFADAVATIKEAEETYLMKNTLSVAVMVPFSTQSRYRVRVENSPTIANVKVIGASKDIARLMENESLVAASFQVSDEAKEGEKKTAKVNFKTPPGVRIVDENQYQMTYTLEARTSPD